MDYLKTIRKIKKNSQIQVNIMEFVKQYIDGCSEVIEEGKYKIDEIYETIDEIISEILENMYHLDPDLRVLRDELLMTVRLTECLKIFDWILLYLVIGSYKSVHKELRFMLESICQAFYIDFNHFSSSLDTKFEVLKALGNYGSFVGSKLIDKTKLNKSLKREIKEIYGILSNYIHPSFEESKLLLKRIKKAKKDQKETLSSIIYSKKFDEFSVNKCLLNCKNVKDLILKINIKFNEVYKSNEIP